MRRAVPPRLDRAEASEIPSQVDLVGMELCQCPCLVYMFTLYTDLHRMLLKDYKARFANDQLPKYLSAKATDLQASRITTPNSVLRIGNKEQTPCHIQTPCRRQRNPREQRQAQSPAPLSRLRIYRRTRGGDRTCLSPPRP